MAELTATDVEEYTQGRLADDDLTQQMLSAALLAARRAVGWHVSPVREETITLDGPGSRILWLPARKVVTLTAVEEDGIDLDVTKLSLSAGDGPYRSRPLALRKRSGGFWTCEYGGIVIELEYGYTEAEAADWRRAILAMTDQIGMATAGLSEMNLSRKTVDDVTYAWSNPYSTMADEAVGSVYHILCDYALPTVELI